MIRWIFPALMISGAAWGQSQQSAPAVWPVPQSSAPAACQNGTGSAVTSVATTATGVCAASTSTGTGARTWFRIWAFDAAGSAGLACTDNGVTPSATNATFRVYGGGGYDSSGSVVLDYRQIQCISLDGSAVTILAQAVQIGTP
jgi:hypothetical protein